MKHVCMILILLALTAGAAFPQVYTGPLNGVYASESPEYVPVGFGLEPDALYVCWIALDENTARFFGTANTIGQNGNVDVYSAAIPDPTNVDNGANLMYTDGMRSTEEGSTVFFRGTNGYYGAWAISEIVDDRLYGTWYYVADGTGDFTGTLVSAATPTWGAVKALFTD